MYLGFSENKTKLKKIKSNELDNLQILSRKVIRVASHFLTSNGDWTPVVSGTNATANTGNTAGLVDLGNTPGILGIRTGSTATGQARIGLLSGGNTSTNILLGRHNWLFESSIRFLALSNSTNSFYIVFGFADTNTSVVTDGVFFRYAHDNNNGNWQCITRINNTENLVNTNVQPITNGFQILTIQVNADNAFFLIDDIIVAYIPSIPTEVNRQTTTILNVVSTVGTASKGIDVDYVELVGQSL